MARAVPELLVEDPRGLDLLVAALRELLAHLALDQPQQDGPVRQPERHPGRLVAKAEQVELRAEPAVVVLARPFEQLEVPFEVLAGVEGGAVDPGQHLALLVAAPVGAGERVELEGADPPGRRRVRAAAEVGERPVAVERDASRRPGRGPGPRSARPCRAGPRPGSARSPRRPGCRRARTARRRRCGRASPPRFAPGRPRSGGLAVGELEVVVEAAVDRRADRDLRPGPQLDDRGRHHVGGVVADQPQRVGGLLALAASRSRSRSRRRREARPPGRAARRRP